MNTPLQLLAEAAKSAGITVFTGTAAAVKRQAEMVSEKKSVLLVNYPKGRAAPKRATLFAGPVTSKATVTSILQTLPHCIGIVQ